MFNEKDMRNKFKQLDKIEISQRTSEKIHAYADEHMQKLNSVQDESVSIEYTDGYNIPAKKRGLKTYKYAAVISVVFLLSAIVLYSLTNNYKNQYILSKPTDSPISSVTPSITATPEKTDNIAYITLCSSQTSRLVYMAKVSDTEPYVRMQFYVLYNEENDNISKENEILTLWISKADFQRKAFDGIELINTYYIAIRGASIDYNNLLKIKAPGTPTPIDIWYLSNTGKWKEWSTSFDTETLNKTANVKFEMINQDSIDKCFISLMYSNGETVIQSPFPIRNNDYINELEQLLNTDNSDNNDKGETGGANIVPYITLREYSNGDFVYYNKQLNSEYIIEYNEVDEYGNNIMLVKRLSPHVIGLEDMYFAAYDKDRLLVGKYHFEYSDESSFQAFEYEGERYYAFTGEIGGMGYKECNFNIFRFNEDKWDSYIDWDYRLKAVINENGIDIYSINTQNSGEEPVYLSSLTYAQLLEGELPKY